ncbi:unnamed protein product [Dovyalis caffra]|uniref:Uncharacterized protein n=1 Tax=Dovyalis caffra TaxID=77055 RepID=A0AAV1QQP8_9ROSI|nr:unnamed protein product [Dovyalis caffra]
MVGQIDSIPGVNPYSGENNRNKAVVRREESNDTQTLLNRCTYTSLLDLQASADVLQEHTSPNSFVALHEEDVKSQQREEMLQEHDTLNACNSLHGITTDTGATLALVGQEHASSIVWDPLHITSAISMDDSTLVDQIGTELSPHAVSEGGLGIEK